jgi:hypothetical protein
MIYHHHAGVAYSATRHFATETSPAHTIHHTEASSYGSRLLQSLQQGTRGRVANRDQSPESHFELRLYTQRSGTDM